MTMLCLQVECLCMSLAPDYCSTAESSSGEARRPCEADSWIPAHALLCKMQLSWTRMQPHPPYVQRSFPSAAHICRSFQLSMCWHHFRSGSKAAAARSRGEHTCSGSKAAGHAAQLSGCLRASWQPGDCGAPAGHRCCKLDAGLFWSPGALQGPACLAAPARCSRGDREHLLQCSIHEVNVHGSPCLHHTRHCCLQSPADAAEAYFAFAFHLGTLCIGFHILQVALVSRY